MVGWALVMWLSIRHSCSYKYVLTHISVCNPNKTHWYQSWTLVVFVLWSVMSSPHLVSRYGLGFSS